MNRVWITCVALFAATLLPARTTSPAKPAPPAGRGGVERSVVPQQLSFWVICGASGCMVCYSTTVCRWAQWAIPTRSTESRQSALASINVMGQRKALLHDIPLVLVTKQSWNANGG
jgi:hypothetical protein